MAEIDSAYKRITAAIVSLASSFQSYSVCGQLTPMKPIILLFRGNRRGRGNPLRHWAWQQVFYPFLVQICTIWANMSFANLLSNYKCSDSPPPVFKGVMTISRFKRWARNDSCFKAVLLRIRNIVRRENQCLFRQPAENWETLPVPMF